MEERISQVTKNSLTGNSRSRSGQVYYAKVRLQLANKPEE